MDGERERGQRERGQRERERGRERGIVTERGIERDNSGGSYCNNSNHSRALLQINCVAGLKQSYCTHIHCIHFYPSKN